MIKYLLHIIVIHIQQRSITLQADFHLPLWQTACVCLQESCYITAKEEEFIYDGISSKLSTSFIIIIMCSRCIVLIMAVLRSN